MSTTAANIISELDLNSSFSELTEAQKLAALNSALQAVSELYNDAGKDAFVQNTLEGASVPVASLKNPARAAYVDSNFTGLSAPFFTSEASAIAYLQALSPVPSTTNPVLMRSFLKPASQSSLNLSTLLSGGIHVQRLDDNQPRILTGTALPTFSASAHPIGTRFLLVPASGLTEEYVSNGSEWISLAAPKRSAQLYAVGSPIASGAPLIVANTANINGFYAFGSFKRIKIDADMWNSLDGMQSFGTKQVSVDIADKLLTVSAVFDGGSNKWHLEVAADGTKIAETDALEFASDPEEITATISLY